MAHKKRTARELILIWSISATFLVGLTAAFLFVVLTPKSNAFTFGRIDVRIEENEYDWNAKQVRLVNENISGAVPGVVRAMILPVLKSKEDTSLGLGGDLQPFEEPGANNQIVMGDFVFTFASDWEDHWFYKDGFFYYRKVLQPGEQTTRLLEKVELTDLELGPKYKDTQIEVEVMADIIQAANNAPEEAWGVYVTGVTVSPDP